MKVIFINRFFHPDHSATSQMLSGIAFGLAAAGHDVRVITSRLRYEGAGAPLSAREKIEGLDVTRIWTTRFGRARLLGRSLDYVTFYMSTALALWRLARAGDVVVVKTDPPLLSIVAGPVVRWRRARLVNWLQDVFPEVAEGLGMGGRGPKAFGMRQLRRLRDRSLRQAERNVVLGERMAEIITEHGASRAGLRIIPNWSDGRLVTPIPHEANMLRREWGLADKFVVGYSGNLGRAHDIATMLAAIERAAAIGDHAQGPRIAWLFVGGGAQTDKLRQEVETRGLTSVVFKPYQPSERLAESLSAADVHLVSLRPSLEGLIVPSKIYGILAAGRPAIFIGAADGEIARLLSSTGTGATVAEGDGSGLADTVIGLARDPIRAGTLGRRARQVFEERFDLPKAQAAWKRMMDELRRPA